MGHVVSEGTQFVPRGSFVEGTDTCLVVRDYVLLSLCVPFALCSLCVLCEQEKKSNASNPWSWKGSAMRAKEKKRKDTL